MQKQDVLKTIVAQINDFAQEEKGNRVTSNNIGGLILKMTTTIMNLPEEKEGDSEKETDSRKEDSKA